jgi:predicted nucleic acid-binding protein
MGIFLDTGFYMGLISKLDENHKKSIKILTEMKSGEYGQIYTSNFVMAESAVLVAIRTDRNSKAIEKLKQLFIGKLKIATILRTDEELEEKIWSLFEKVNCNPEKKKNSKLVSFVDCSNIILCQNHGIDKIATFDPHFKPWLQIINN